MTGFTAIATEHDTGTLVDLSSMNDNLCYCRYAFPSEASMSPLPTPQTILCVKQNVLLMSRGIFPHTRCTLYYLHDGELLKKTRMLGANLALIPNGVFSRPCSSSLDVNSMPDISYPPAHFTSHNSFHKSFAQTTAVDRTK